MDRLDKLKLLFLILVPVVILDQVSKVLIANNLYQNQSIELIPGFLNIVYVRNPGAAFGILKDANPLIRILSLIIVAFIALVIIYYLYMRVTDGNLWEKFGLGLIMGGTIGNLVDRIRMGEVVDFIDIYIKSYHWPAFNVADTAITSGVVLMLITSIFQTHSSQSSQ